MFKPLSHGTHHAYRHVVKPILFTQPPDAVHERIVRTGSAVQQLAPARGLMRGVWAYHNPAYLKQTVAGVVFSNPVGLSAGFDKNFQLATLMKHVGFGFMEGGSLTLHPYAGNARPWFHRLPKTQSLVVNAGLANQGVERIIERIKQYPAGTFAGFPLNISVAKTNSSDACTTEDAVADYVGSLRAIQKAGVGQFITLNISCPNTYGGQPFTTPGRLEALLAATDQLNLEQPLFIKMPSHLPWSEFEPLVDVAAGHRVTGLTIANLAYREQVAVKDPLPESVHGKLSGRPTADLSNQLIRRTREATGDRFVIIGVGGIFNAADAYTKIRVGANLVELITGLIFEGPQLIGQINHGLVQLLKRDGLTNISQAVSQDL